MDAAQLKYAKTHEWVDLQGETATIGISEFAVQALTDLVFLELPAVGKKLQQGASFGVVESVKSANDLYAPVSGEVTAVNTPLTKNMDPLSSDPFGTGWLLKLKVAPGIYLSHLMDHAAYQQHCAAEAH